MKSDTKTRNTKKTIVRMLAAMLIGGVIGGVSTVVYEIVFGEDFSGRSLSLLTEVTRRLMVPGLLSVQAAAGLIASVTLKSLIIMLPFMAFGFVVTLLVSIVQVGWKVSTKPMKPELSKLNPLNGFKRIFSKDSLFELVKSILKIVIIIYIAYTSIKDNANDLFALYDLGLNQAVALVGTLIINTGIKISIVYLVIGLADFIYQKHKFNEDMKMTKQEVKDEYKNTEGDPQIKGRQRRKMHPAGLRQLLNRTHLNIHPLETFCMLLPLKFLFLLQFVQQ